MLSVGVGIATQDGWKTLIETRARQESRLLALLSTMARCVQGTGEMN
jgi:hypothetical protein